MSDCGTCTCGTNSVKYPPICENGKDYMQVCSPVCLFCICIYICICVWDCTCVGLCNKPFINLLEQSGRWIFIQIFFFIRSDFFKHPSMCNNYILQCWFDLWIWGKASLLTRYVLLTWETQQRCHQWMHSGIRNDITFRKMACKSNMK